MYANQDNAGNAATEHVVISFAPYAAAAWARAERAAPAEGPRGAVIIPFPRRSPDPRAVAVDPRAAAQPGSMSDPF